MKPKHFFILLLVFILNSCIIKSINPFYTKDKIVFEERIVGDWKSKNGQWKIKDFKTVWKEFEKEEEEISDSDKFAYETYQDSYAVEYIHKGKAAGFIATAFKVGNETLLDFTPFDYENDSLNRLVAQHLLNTHSVCLVEFGEDNLELKWLDEDVIERLIENNNLKIKHERTGFDEEIVLTANSEELHRFLEKFIKSDIENKWEDDQTYTLTPVNE